MADPGFPRGGQWRIQNFPEGGANSQSGCADLIFFAENCMKIAPPPKIRHWWCNNLLFGKIFAKNCMEMKEIGPRGALSVSTYLDPSLTCVIKIFHIIKKI